MSHDAEWYRQLAERATERALRNMASEDVGVELSLAKVAWDAGMGMATDDERADIDEYELTDDGGYELSGPSCICPPELVARGGFRGSCPARHQYDG